MTRLASVAALKERQVRVAASRPVGQQVVAVCGGTGCLATGCKDVAKALEKELGSAGLKDRVTLVVTGCHGFCEQGPIVVVRPQSTFYPRVQVKDVPEIVARTLAKGEVIERLLYVDPVSGTKIERESDIPFYKGQTRIIFESNGHLSPTSLDDYLARGGYGALAKALTTHTPEQVIDEVTRAGLRGRGGGGFSTGRKWASARSAKGEPKYVICNADEGDPGAFMDRSLLEGNPHSVIEGMLIGAYAVGSRHGYVYVRHEYPLAVENLRHALEQARAAGLLGEGILGTTFGFDIVISRGGGAFVCGESTALMASLEGKVGEPRAKYVHTVEHGLFDKPTVLNNVETWANVPAIIANGAAAYASLGTDNSKGTKIFSLVGKINNTGLVEVPMGITLREVVFGIGGGIPGGKKFKAVQTGGPSGGCLPESLLDLPVDFQRLTEAGSMMGSGGMIVMDEDTCMVDVARYFIDFLARESCGKCTPCREGLLACRDILARICEGKGKDEDLSTLDELGQWMTAASLCALGGSAANPVLSTLRYFKHEYLAHIREHRCPGGVCKELITYSIDTGKCNGCHACVKACPPDAISGALKAMHTIDAAACIKCGACLSVCKQDAVVRR
ncbi:MAG: NAD(P)H-dependent oxidoreductase subunit E [Myxococcota bacterium]|jgi:NADH-quinone oxidoreductase subunit F|nr:NAD(P)H-dependent oxidoreductase subunit E [Myxococcota bacterium]